MITASKIFPLGWYFTPWDTAKTHTYYMTILKIMSSVKFKHFNLKQYHIEPAYSTSIIKHVLHLTDWKQPLHNGINFPINFRTKLHNHCQTYSYWDYQQAWFHAFFSSKIQRKPFLVILF